MTASEFALLAFVFGGLIIFAGFHGLHAWVLIRRQEAQIVRLQRTIALMLKNPSVDDFVAAETSPPEVEDPMRRVHPAA